MSRSLGNDIGVLLRGLQLVSHEAWKLQEREVRDIWVNSAVKSVIAECKKEKNKVCKSPPSVQDVQSKISKLATESIERSRMVVEGVRTFVSISRGSPVPEVSNLQYSELMKEANEAIKQSPYYSTASEAMDSSYVGSTDTWSEEIPPQASTEKLSKVQEPIILSTAKEPETEIKAEPVNKTAPVGTSTIKTKPKVKQSLSQTAKQRAVPASRLGRLFSFGSLAAGLGVGTVAEASRRALGFKPTSVGSALDASTFLSEANVERIVNTLCKVRGAALKIGQILSIQDNSIISPQLQKAFERVRQSADFMPQWQVEKVLSSELGTDWRSKMASFEPKPFAAASIGQVHLATLHDGTEVAMKIQYPGVAQGINSDIENLVAVMNVWNIFPKGLFIDNLVEVAKRELSWEVDYEREAECTKKFKKLIEPYPEYVVPTVVDELSTRQIFTSQLIEGMPVDQCINLDYETRCKISLAIMNLCLKELFEFRYMQTDPNWSNFFYDPETQKLGLLDFGATRAYEKPFMDMYIQVIKCAADGDRDGVLKMSRAMGFLTGYESKVMEQAHVDTVMILGEVFRRDQPFDFGRQDTTRRVQGLVPTMIDHRLCPPPEQIYSLHRKLSGVFLLCAKLKVSISCRPLFEDVWRNYRFGEEQPATS